MGALVFEYHLRKAEETPGASPIFHPPCLRRTIAGSPAPHQNPIRGIFSQDPTVTFRLLYVLLIIEYDRRRILHVNVTAHPTAAWVCQQLREAFPFDTAVRYVLLDRDAIFSTEVGRVLEHMDVRPVRTSVQSPWPNGVAERWIGTCRRELLDHVIVLNEEHLRRLVRKFIEYYHTDRTHLSLRKDAPTPRAVCVPSSPSATVVALPRVDGLHHRYEWRDAA